MHELPGSTKDVAYSSQVPSGGSTGYSSTARQFNVSDNNNHVHFSHPASNQSIGSTASMSHPQHHIAMNNNNAPSNYRGDPRQSATQQTQAQYQQPPQYQQQPQYQQPPPGPQGQYQQPPQYQQQPQAQYQQQQAPVPQGQYQRQPPGQGPQGQPQYQQQPQEFVVPMGSMYQNNGMQWNPGASMPFTYEGYQEVAEKTKLHVLFQNLDKKYPNLEIRMPEWHWPLQAWNAVYDQYLKTLTVQHYVDKKMEYITMLCGLIEVGLVKLVGFRMAEGFNYINRLGVDLFRDQLQKWGEQVAENHGQITDTRPFPIQIGWIIGTNFLIFLGLKYLALWMGMSTPESIRTFLETTNGGINQYRLNIANGGLGQAEQKSIINTLSHAFPQYKEEIDKYGNIVGKFADLFGGDESIQSTLLKTFMGGVAGGGGGGGGGPPGLMGMFGNLANGVFGNQNVKDERRKPPARRKRRS